MECRFRSSNHSSSASSPKRYLLKSSQSTNFITNVLYINHHSISLGQDEISEFVNTKRLLPSLHWGSNPATYAYQKCSNQMNYGGSLAANIVLNPMIVSKNCSRISYPKLLNLSRITSIEYER